MVQPCRVGLAPPNGFRWGKPHPTLVWLVTVVAIAPPSVCLSQTVYQVSTAHPRLLIEDVPEAARRCDGPLAADYQIVKQRADDAVQRGGIQYISNAWSIPEDLMNCGLAYLIERQRGRDARPYAEVIIKQWGDGSLIANREGSHFGYHALAYDWIYDALTPEQRVQFGDALGSWLRYFTDEPRILLKWGPLGIQPDLGTDPPEHRQHPRRDHAEALHRTGHQRFGHEIRGGRQDLSRLLEPARAGGVHPGV